MKVFLINAHTRTVEPVSLPDARLQNLVIILDSLGIKSAQIRKTILGSEDLIKD